HGKSWGGLAMRGMIRRFATALADAFWLIPAVLILSMGAVGFAVVAVQSLGDLPDWIPADLIYGGGETGARTLLGVVATSSIAVAGTIFSVTLAALSLASSQLGPRLLRNFTQDRGNQVTLGVLLGAFVYSTVVLRSVRGGSDEFVPSLGVTVAMLFAAACVATLVYFVHHVANRINVDTVVTLVHRDLAREVGKLSPRRDADDPRPPDDFCLDGQAVLSDCGAYVLDIDLPALADWAKGANTRVRLLRGPGAFVLPGERLALVEPHHEEAEAVVRRAVAFSPLRQSGDALAYAMQQLVSVAVRALSPGINDPLTAMMVVDRLGAILAELSERALPSGVASGPDGIVAYVPMKDYEAYVVEAFGLIVESAAGAPTVLERVVHVIGDVAAVEPDPDRRESLRRMVRRARDTGLAVLAGRPEIVSLNAAYSACLRKSVGPARFR
ncbi:MAG: DUF2254 domain-containing protein, partial [Phenylobacterium sp.]|nr:DUF2254 domain-containing protein [Phenylobacterium sp.]